ncbi:MAG: STAS/SEC14 domain-containing protein [Bacteroidota bacterium]|nr:STAS/SEC14 domain-containing protein [Bacteroidota bacterium]
MYHKTTNIIKHKGKDIALLDYTNLKKPEQFAENVGKTIERIKYYKENNIKNLLVLTDLTGSFIYGEGLKYLKESTKLGRPFVKKSAVIGLSRSKKIMLNMINIFSGYETKAFSNKEDALDWLAE